MPIYKNDAITDIVCIIDGATIAKSKSYRKSIVQSKMHCIYLTTDGCTVLIAGFDQQ